MYSKCNNSFLHYHIFITKLPSPISKFRMPIPDAIPLANIQHKLLTIYTDSAPNSLSELNYPNLSNPVVDFEHDGTSNWTSNSETVGHSLVNFEVSETETCASNLSDDFHALPDYFLHNAVYLPATFPNSSTCYTEQGNVNSYGDSASQNLMWPFEEVRGPVNVMPELLHDTKFLPDVHLNYQKGSVPGNDAYVSLPAYMDVSRISQPSNGLECENTVPYDVHGLIEFPKEAIVYNTAQSFASQLEVTSSFIPVNDFTSEQKNTVLSLQNSSFENYAYNSCNYLEEAPNFYMDSSVCIHTVGPYNTGDESYHVDGYGLHSAPLGSYEVVDQTTKCPSYDFVPVNHHGYTYYDSSEAAYYNTLSEGLSGPLVYSNFPPNNFENQQPDYYADATIFVSNFPDSLISQENKRVSAYLIPESNRGSCLEQGDNYAEPAVHVPFSTPFELKDVDSFHCSDSLQRTQAHEMPLATILPTESSNCIVFLLSLHKPPSSEIMSENTEGVENPTLSRLLHRKAWICRFCDQRFDTYSQLRAHMVRHKDKQVYACHLMEKHQFYKKDGPTCETCGQHFLDFEHLVRHLLPRRNGSKSGCSTLCVLSRKKKSRSFKRPAKFSSLSVTNDAQHQEKSSKSSCSTTVGCFDSKFSLLPLQTIKDDDLTVGYKCPFCVEIFRSFKHIEAHLSERHSSMINRTASKSSFSKKTADIEVNSCVSSSSNIDPHNSTSSLSNTDGSCERALFLLQLEKCVVSQRSFQKPKFFNDHELLCLQSIEERARRNRLRASKREVHCFRRNR
ncbi:unnamed protein product [Heterobilharzia americana]|nr:unnamed protein product [Heterobilharzia americana]